MFVSSLAALGFSNDGSLPAPRTLRVRAPCPDAAIKMPPFMAAVLVFMDAVLALTRAVLALMEEVLTFRGAPQVGVNGELGSAYSALTVTAVDQVSSPPTRAVCDARY